MSDPVPPSLLLTPREVAALFDVDPKTVNRWAAAGLLGVRRTPGGHRRYLRTEVETVLRTAAVDHPELFGPRSAVHRAP